jgi:hypothetical protein
MSDWADFHHELSRKVTDALSDRLERHERGEISTHELVALVGCMYDITSGLVEPDVMRLLGAIHKDIADKIKEEGKPNE